MPLDKQKVDGSPSNGGPVEGGQTTRAKEGL